jgi:hypothetical protein
MLSYHMYSGWGGHGLGFIYVGLGCNVYCLGVQGSGVGVQGLWCNV